MRGRGTHTHRGRDIERESGVSGGGGGEEGRALDSNLSVLGFNPTLCGHLCTPPLFIAACGKILAKNVLELIATHSNTDGVIGRCDIAVLLLNGSCLTKHKQEQPHSHHVVANCGHRKDTVNQHLLEVVPHKPIPVLDVKFSFEVYQPHELPFFLW